MNTSHSEKKIQTQNVIDVLKNNRKTLIASWVCKVKEEFGDEVTLTDEEFADHMIYIIDALIDEFLEFQMADEKTRQHLPGDMTYNDGHIADSKQGGKKHGHQRANINAYNGDKVYWEYVLLRKVLVDFLQQHHLLDIDHLEIVTCVIERCTRQSMAVFTDTLHTTQRKLLGTVVHDIRSPLYVISMLGELAVEQHDIVKTPDYGKRINSATARIALMLEDMLQTLSIESGQGIELNFKQASLNGLLSTVAEDAISMYGDKLKVNLPTEEIATVFDEIMFKRIFENLISNAFKYGDQRSDVTVSAAKKNGNIVLEVHNFGNPIAEEEWDEIFRFFKSHESREEKHAESWGIGLAFVKSAVEGHGGTVSLSSDRRNGTCFKIELPDDININGQTKIVKIE